MNDPVTIAATQLGRMRGMTRLYHERFFDDVRFQVALIVALFVVGFWGVEQAFLLIPVVALFGAVQTAFDASYLIFARHYAARLEAYVNDHLDDPVLVASSLESTYLFPLGDTKIVTAAFGSGFSWFGFVTLFYTALGSACFLFGLALGWPVLDAAGGWWRAGYLGVLGSLVMLALGVGAWWFVGGVGERRLTHVLDAEFPSA